MSSSSQEEINKIITNTLVKENIKNADIKIENGVEKGDGFLSLIRKVTVKAEGRILNLIIKTPPLDPRVGEILPVEELYSREIRFYQKIYPVFQEFQKKKEVKDPFNNVPFCFDIIGNNIVLQNLLVKGFKLREKKIGLDEEHVKKILELYGKFHAISLALKEQEKDLYDNLIVGLEDVFHKFSKEGLVELRSIEPICDLFDDDFKVKEKVLNLSKNAENFVFGLAKNKAKYEVVNHGDCGNMMFKYEEGTNRLLDIMIYDFQLLRTSSPVMDLSTFLYCQTDKEIYTNLNEYLKVYHQSLSNYLISLGSDAENLYPFEALKSDWIEYSKFGFIMATLCIRVKFMESQEAINFLNVTDLQNERKLMTSFKRADEANEKLKDLTLHMVQNNFL